MAKLSDEALKILRKYHGNATFGLLFRDSGIEENVTINDLLDHISILTTSHQNELIEKARTTEFQKERADNLFDQLYIATNELSSIQKKLSTANATIKEKEERIEKYKNVVKWYEDWRIDPVELPK